MDVSATAKALQADVLRLITPHVNPETRAFIATLRRAVRTVELVPADIIATAPSVFSLPRAPSLKDLSSSNSTLRRANLARLAAYASISVHLHEYIDDVCCRHYWPTGDGFWAESDNDGGGEIVAEFALPSDNHEENNDKNIDEGDGQEDEDGNDENNANGDVDGDNATEKSSAEANPEGEKAKEATASDADEGSDPDVSTEATPAANVASDDGDGDTKSGNDSADAVAEDLTADLASTLEHRANTALKGGNVRRFS